MYASVDKVIIGSYNGLLHDWHQAIIWTNGGLLLIGPLGISLYEILSEIHTFSLKTCIRKCQPFCLSLNMWITIGTQYMVCYVIYGQGCLFYICQRANNHQNSADECCWTWGYGDLMEFLAGSTGIDLA